MKVQQYVMASRDFVEVAVKLHDFPVIPARQK